LILSIITITYNDFEGLKKTLSSIPKFDYIESIVINGGTDQQSLEFLSTYKGKVISEKDEGIADAFNKGIANSFGEAIMFLNSGDELIEPTYIDKAEQLLKKDSSIDFIHSNLILVDSIGTELYMKPTFCNLGRGLPYLHPTMILKKSVFEKIGFFSKDYNIAMDFDFIVRLEKKGFKGYYNKDNAVVKMEGTGRSIEYEFDGIKECYTSLKRNNFLTLTNAFGLMVRISLFIMRKFMITIGLGALLKKLKSKKHSPKRIV